MSNHERFPLPSELAVQVPPEPKHQYDAYARRYGDSSTKTVATILQDAQIMGPTELNDTAEVEVIAWRVDSDLLDDGRLTFASRFRMVARRSGSIVLHRNLILPMHIMSERAGRLLRDGTGEIVDIYDMTYQDVDMERHNGPALLVESGYARFIHTPVAGDIYKADPRKAKDTVYFPSLPRYEDVTTQGFMNFCMRKAKDSLATPIVQATQSMITMAQGLDRKQPIFAENLGQSKIFAEGAPSDLRERISSMVGALRAYKAGEPLTPRLVAVLLDPHAEQVAKVAQTNKSLYVEQISTREYTPAIPRQLDIVARMAPMVRTALQPLLEADSDGYRRAMHTALEPVRGAVDGAEAFRDHITTKTMPFEPRYWRVRAV
jgi:hypothetical protein